MVEKLNVNGREVVQIPIEDYNEIMGFIQAEKQKKDDFYRKRIEMAKQHLADGTPSLDIDEMFDRCRERAIKRRLGNAANE